MILDPLHLNCYEPRVQTPGDIQRSCQGPPGRKTVEAHYSQRIPHGDAHRSLHIAIVYAGLQRLGEGPKSRVVSNLGNDDSGEQAICCTWRLGC